MAASTSGKLSSEDSVRDVAELESTEEFREEERELLEELPEELVEEELREDDLQLEPVKTFTFKEPQ